MRDTQAPPPPDERPMLWLNARLATCDEPMRFIEHGAFITRAGRFEWVGPSEEVPMDSEGGPLLGSAAPSQGAALNGAACSRPHGGRHLPRWESIVNLHGAWVTPGLIDCHTHLVFAGNRAGEYGQRLRGRTYEEIAGSGGGILSTMQAVRAASLQQLIDESAPRLGALIGEGVTTVEIKSGYGLTLEDEAKMLRAARALGQAFPAARVTTTLLAAHTLPPEYSGRPATYIDCIAREWLPALHEEGLVDAVDVFCEHLAFDTTQAARLFDAAHALGVPVKMHAEQLSNIGGSLLAASRGALSCDHLEHATEAEAHALARSGTVAVLLPQAFYCLGAERKPPIAALRAAGARMAVATDCNPGSAPGASLLTTLSMATRLFGLTPEEALAGVTRHAAQALGLAEEVGSLAPGRVADFAIWHFDSPQELGYWIGLNRLKSLYRAGRRVE